MSASVPPEPPGATPSDPACQQHSSINKHKKRWKGSEQTEISSSSLISEKPIWTQPTEQNWAVSKLGLFWNENKYELIRQAPGKLPRFFKDYQHCTAKQRKKGTYCVNVCVWFSVWRDYSSLFCFKLVIFQKNSNSQQNHGLLEVKNAYDAVLHIKHTMALFTLQPIQICFKINVTVNNARTFILWKTENEIASVNVRFYFNALIFIWAKMQ